MRNNVKCLYCEFLGLESKTTGRCSKTKQIKKIAEYRECKLYNLAPIHNVKWREGKIK